MKSLSEGVNILRKLVFSILAILLWMPVTSNAMGLGGVQIHSALNQILDAEIEILSASEEELSSLSIKLASYETFARVGIDRPAILLKLRFSVKKNSSGSDVIAITSRETIREPFLDFIIEANWRAGRILREYTLLLDPPELAKAKTNVQTSRNPFADASPQRTDNRVNRENSAPQPMNMAETTAPSRAASPQSQRTTTQPQRTAQRSYQQGDMVYGPITDGDTLWSIANQMRPNRQVSVYQVMRGLYSENPDAFINNNINRLRKGSVLRIDDPESLVQVDRTQARLDVTRLMEQPIDTSIDPDKAFKSMASTVSPEVIGSDIASTTRPNLKLVTPDEGGKDTASSSAGDGVSNQGLRKELMLALEISEAQRQENVELKQRMIELQKQLDALQRLVSLKDNDLAQLQSQLSGDETQPVIAPTEAVKKEAEQIAVEEKPVAEKPVDELKVEDTNKVEKVAVPAKADEKPAEPEKVVATAEAPKKEVPPKKISPKKFVPPPPEPTILDMILDNQIYLIAGGSTLILIMILGLIIVRRRKKGFQESILTGGTSSMLSAKGDAGPDTSFLSDLAISGMGAGGFPSDDGEVDPLTEADVYMAYGRNQQAEELLKSAIASKPERLDYSQKLLEVYFNTKNREQFETHVNEVAEHLQKDDDIWKKVVAMGHQIAPEHPLFIEAPEGVELPETGFISDESGADGDVLDIGLDLDELSAEMESEGSEMEFDLGVDFSELDDILGDGDASDDIDLDLGGDSKEEPSDDDFDLGLDEHDDSSTDFDLDLDAESGDSTDESIADDFSLGDIGSESEQSIELDLDSTVADFGEDALDLTLPDLELDASGDDSLDLSLDSDGVEALDELSLDDGTATESDEISFDDELPDLSLDEEQIVEHETPPEITETQGEDSLDGESEYDVADEELVSDDDDEDDDDVEFNLDIDESSLPSLDSSLDIDAELDHALLDLQNEESASSDETQDAELIDESIASDEIDETLSFDNDEDSISTTFEDELSLTDTEDDEESFEPSTEDELPLTDTDDESLGLEEEVTDVDDLEPVALSLDDDFGVEDASSDDSEDLAEDSFEFEDSGLTLEVDDTTSTKDALFGLVDDAETPDISESGVETEFTVDDSELSLDETQPDEMALELATDTQDDEIDLEMSVDELPIQDDEEPDQSESDDDSLFDMSDLEEVVDFEIVSATEDDSSEDSGEFSIDDMALESSESEEITSELDLLVQDVDEETSEEDSALSIDELTIESDDESITEDLEEIAIEESSDESTDEIGIDSLEIDDADSLDDFSIEFDTNTENDDDFGELSTESLTEDDDIGFELSTNGDGHDQEFEDALSDLESLIGDDREISIDDDSESDVISVEDEIGTKLDLAKAYIDMGDAESARGMLNEVVEQGDESQQQQAQSLLDDIK